MAMRTYLEEVNLGLLVGLKESCEEKTRTLETINKTGVDTLLRPKYYESKVKHLRDCAPVGGGMKLKDSLGCNPLRVLTRLQS